MSVRPLSGMRQLLTNARIAVWRRYRYRKLLDIPRDFILRSTSDAVAPRPSALMSKPLSLSLRTLRDPLYLRVSNSDFAVFEEIFDRDEYAAIKQWKLPENAAIIDLGANIGLASVYFTALAPAARVVAVEPDADNCRVLRMNCKRLLDDGRLQVFCAFIAANDGTAGIDREESSWAFHKVDTIDASHEAVPCFSMEHLLDESGLADRIDLLKCDIEGSERELFAGCASWIGRVKHLVCETHAPYLNADLYRDLRAAGWDFEIALDRQNDVDGIAFLRNTQASG
jgi:FkbM family methyltransferase